jgi:hypothetical protein
MLDNIGFPEPEGSRLLEDGPYQSIFDHYRDAWLDFREFVRSIAHGAVIPALAQLHLHYPTVDLQRVVARYA